MAISEEILIVANQLANAGNKPTVALIKAKLKKKVPLPVIISTLKAWQYDPSFITMSKTSEEKHEINCDIKDTEDTEDTEDTNNFRKQLNDELGEMRQEIFELKQLIQSLIKQQKS